MNSDFKMKRVEEDDPKRCQCMTKVGQCRWEAVEGRDFCKMHGGNVANKNLRNYRLEKFNQKFAQAANSPEIKSLKDEIGILRVLIEEKINFCNDPMDLMMQSNTISDLIMKVKAVVESCHKLDERLGIMMDRDQAIQFAVEISDLIGRHVVDPDVLESLSSELENLIASKIK
jgi:hypothetical protein